MYQKVVLGRNFSTDDLFSDMIGDTNNIDDMLPVEFVDNIDELTKMPLQDMVESIYSEFKLDNLKEQNAYICAFYDQVSDFSSNNSGNLSKFIETWGTDICSKTIQSDETDGIRLVSIHKSKGLEFPIVFLALRRARIPSPKSTSCWA